MNSIELRAAIKATLTDRALSGDFCRSLLRSLTHIALEYGDAKYNAGYSEGHSRATEYALMIERQLNEDIADLCGTFYDEELGHHSGDEVDNEILGRLREQRMTA